MPRPLTRQELVEMDLTQEQINVILEKQNQKRERKYRYIVMLTTAEAEKLSKQEGKRFIRATEWTSQWDTRKVKTQKKPSA